MSNATCQVNCIEPEPDSDPECDRSGFTGLLATSVGIGIGIGIGVGLGLGLENRGEELVGIRADAARALGGILDDHLLVRFDAEERRKIARRPDGSSPLNVSGPRFEHLWPKDDFQTTPEAERSIAWTNWPMFTLGLVIRGHRDEEIQRILGGNVLRVIRANA